MTSKPRKRSTRKVKSLKVKSLSADNAKHVKGGPINPPWRDQGGATQKKELRKDVILLRDLAPRTKVKGGADKRVFGQEAGEGGLSGTTPSKRKRQKGKSKP